MVRSLWRKYDWRAPNWLLVVHTCESASQAKGFQSACGTAGPMRNLINALKLLANQQEDGDSPIQSIVKVLCERNRKGTTEGLRNFIKWNNHSALEVGHLHLGEGTRSFEVPKAKVRRREP